MTIRAGPLPSPTVVVVEDDPAIREGLVDALGCEGHRVLQAADAAGGRRITLHAACDLVLLDLMLPGGHGFEILKEIRRVRPELPVIILTARGRESDRVQGLRLGADDYVVKPFSIRELLARVDAVLRRVRIHGGPGQAEPVQLRIPDGLADLARREIRFDDGTRTELSERETALLRYLAHNRERAVGRDELLQHVWQVRRPMRCRRSSDPQRRLSSLLGAGRREFGRPTPPPGRRRAVWSCVGPTP